MLNNPDVFDMKSVTTVAPLHPQEDQRLIDLYDYGVFGTPTSSEYDDLVLLAATICNAPIALLSLVGDEKLHFKSSCGFNEEFTARKGSFCSHAILHDGVMVVEDTTKDPRFNTHPLVICPTNKVRFYAGAPLLSQNGLPLGVVCVLGDQPQSLTDAQIKGLKTVAHQIVSTMELKKSYDQLKDYSEQLKSLNKHKDRFFSIIAHDLRGAFHGIMGFAEVLDQEYDSMEADSIKRIVRYLSDSSVETYQLLENLLEWASLDEGSIKFHPSHFDIGVAISNISDRFTASAAKKEINLVVKTQHDIDLYADRHMFESIVHNLISNALKFTHRGGQVTVSSEIEGDRLRIDIIDTGVGMSQSKIKKLFSLETTSTVRGTSGEAGSGLGLILCREFVDRHFGSISVKSTPGEGSTFSVHLPIKVKAASNS